MFPQFLYQWSKRVLGVFLPPYLYSYLMIELFVVGWLDWRYLRISNFWVLLNLIVFIILAVAMPLDYFSFPRTFFYPLLFFILGFFLFSLNVMGGGDSKFLSTFFLLIPIKMHDQYLNSLIYGILICSGGLMIYHTFKNLKKLKSNLLERNFIGLFEIYKKKIPLAPIILFSWFIFGYTIELWKG